MTSWPHCRRSRTTRPRPTPRPLSQQAQELSSKATALIGELVSDPDLATAVTDCTKKLQTVG